MIYTRARWADEAHTQVIGWDAEGNSETRSIDNPHEFRREDEFLTGFLASGREPEPYEPPAAQTTPPHLNNTGLVRFSGASPTAVFEAIRVLSVTRVAKGRYRAYHETPMPSDQYSVNPSVLDANPRLVRTTTRTSAFVEVRVTDLAGTAQDATEITIETQRVVYP